jgi:hypothetical protein
MKQYSIVDNGSMPFLVKVHERLVQVCKFSSWNEDIEEEEYDRILKAQEGYDELILSIKNPKKVWIGKDIPCNDSCNTIPNEYIGNSVLVQKSKNVYVFIGWIIYKFTSKDQIIRYYSPMGANEVSYPMAMTNNNQSILMTDMTIVDNPKNFRAKFLDDPLFLTRDFHQKKITGKPIKTVTLVERLV